MKRFQGAIVHTTTKVTWSISHAISFVSLCIVIFLFSCSKDKTEESNLLLGENEICLNEKLVSITRNGDDYYIGTESSGHIFVYSSTTEDVIDTLNTDYGRIYQVKRPHEDNIFFVGTQNMGLKKTHQRGDSLITDITYKIKGKGYRYSCYDIFFDNDTVYAMTSHGIFKVGKSDTLDSIFTHTDSNGVPNPLVANNMVKASGYLFAATDSGVVVIKNHEVVDTIAEKIKIKNVAYHNNFIYTLGDCLYKINPASLEVVDTVKLKASARYYFHADSIHHFLSDSYMVLAHDSVLHKPEQHKQVNTRRKLSLEGHNVIADGKEYSLLVAENALWQVGHHYPSVFGNLKKEGGVKLACTDGKSAYFLVGKKVYKLGANNVANEVLELKDEIKLMECKQDSGIYYVNSDTCVYFQRFNQEEPEFIGKSDKEITAMCIHNSVSEGVILGIRDGLIYMEKKKVPEPITLEMNNGNKDTIPYIRRFAATESNYYCPTMNEGIFYGSGKELHSYEKSCSIQFIRDVVCPDSKLYEDLYWLTNKYLYLSSNDSVPNENYGSRLLASRHGSRIVYVLGEIGGVRAIQPDSIISDRNKKGAILFSDIVFRPESSFMLNDTLYLGGQSGVIAFSNEDVKEMFKENKSLKYHYVEFKDKEESKFSLWIVFGGAIIVIIGLLVFYNRTIIIRRLRKRLKDIQDKVGVLFQVKENLEKQLCDALSEAEKLSNSNDDYKKQLNDIQSKIDVLCQEKDGYKEQLDDAQSKVSKLSQENDNYKEQLDDALSEVNELSQKNEDYKKQLDDAQSEVSKLAQEKTQIKNKVQEKMQLIEKTKPYLSQELQKEFNEKCKSLEKGEGLDQMIHDLSILEGKVWKELKMKLSEIKYRLCKTKVFQSDLSELKNEIEETLNNGDIEKYVTCINNDNALKNKIDDVSQKLEKYSQSIVILDTDVNKLLFGDIKVDKLSLDEAQNRLKEMNETIPDDIKKKIEECLDKLLGLLNGDNINADYVKNLKPKIELDKSSLSKNGITRDEIYTMLQDYATVEQECLMHHELYILQEKLGGKNDILVIKPFVDLLSEDYEISEKLKNIHMTSHESKTMQALVLIMILPNCEKKYRQVDICKKCVDFYKIQSIHKSQVNNISKFLSMNYEYFKKEENKRYLTALLAECKDKLYYVGDAVSKG